MVDFAKFLSYLLVMAGVTYLVRMLPLVLVRKKFENRFIRSFLYYIPYAVLGVMTVPAVFYSTGSMLSAAVGFIAALTMAYFEKSLITVASTACGAVLIVELLEKFL
ncbi:MAG: AzlD domain-containing protein [Clostridia bacterium]|nr:AzlD domain-containing protein [Clostridia bacterium]